MAIVDPKFKWGTEIEYNFIKVCNDEGSNSFKDKVNKFSSENQEVSKWLKINTEKASFPLGEDCYDIEAIMGVFEGVDTENFMKTCDFFQTVLECIYETKKFNCIDPKINTDMKVNDTSLFTFHGKPQLTI
jgi:hypothetical protein